MCSTVFGDSVCRGCMRFVHEIIDWNRYSEAQKKIIWQRLDEHLYIILPQFVRIFDPGKVLAAAERYQIPQPSHNLWRCVYNLIRFRDKRAIDFADCGFRLRDDCNLPELDQQLYQLSNAIYERDFIRARQIQG